MDERNQENYQENEYSDIASHAGKTAARFGGNLLKQGVRAVGKGLGKALFALLKSVGPYILLAAVVIILAYAIFNFVQDATLDDFVSTLEINVPNTDTESLLTYIDTLSEAERARYLAEYDINLKILKQYMELENETVAKDTESKVKLETTTKVISNGTTTSYPKTTTDYERITLEKAQASYPYRLYWQLLAGIDIYTNTSQISEEYTWTRTIPKKAMEYLMPEYTWTREGQYTRDVINKSETIVINKYNGSISSQVTTLKEDKYIYPLPYLKKVKTAFGTYTYDYTEKITTTEHEWGEYVVTEGPIEYHESDTPSGYYLKKNPKTGKWEPDPTRPYYDTWTTQTITKKRYSKTYQVNENLLKSDPEFVLDTEPFKKFMTETNIGLSELEDIYEIISKLPTSYECVEALSLALNEYGLLNDLDGVSIHTARPLNLDITLPAVAGSYTRNDIVNTAKSLLGLPYFWGGKYNEIGVNKEWGTLKTVTSTGSWSTGKAIPYGLDCSGFISWAYNQIMIPAGQKFPDGTQNQYVSAMLIPVSEAELLPGDIGYTKGIDHVGMYIGKVEDLPVFIHAGGRLYSSTGKPAGQVVLSYNNTSTYYEGNAPTKFVKFFRLKYRYKGE